MRGLKWMNRKLEAAILVNGFSKAKDIQGVNQQVFRIVNQFTMPLRMFEREIPEVAKNDSVLIGILYSTSVEMYYALGERDKELIDLRTISIMKSVLNIDPSQKTWPISVLVQLDFQRGIEIGKRAMEKLRGNDDYFAFEAFAYLKDTYN